MTAREAVEKYLSPRTSGGTFGARGVCPICNEEDISGVLVHRPDCYWATRKVMHVETDEVVGIKCGEFREYTAYRWVKKTLTKKALSEYEGRRRSQ